MPTPPANATVSTFQLGTYAAATDTFTSVLDLNDRSTWWIQDKGLKLDAPDEVDVRAFNIRTPGEAISRIQYKNRHITVSAMVKAASTTALLSQIRTLLGIVKNPPFVIRIALPGATQYSYADVIKCKHNIPTEAQLINAKAIKDVTLDFECGPFFRGDRQTLSNLVVNPGFEAPSGPGVPVFADAFPNTNAYSVLAGSAPSVASSVMTIPNNGQLAFGSPAWGPINQWTVRFQWATGLVPVFSYHWTDANNRLSAQIDSNLYINHVIGGASHNSGITAVAMTNGNWYWITLTQFPAASGSAPQVVATLYNDSAGVIGSQVATTGVQTASDSVTALAGRPVLWAGGSAALKVGGAFANVHTVSLFGPGGWTWTGGNGGTGIGSGAWEQNTSNTYPSGPVTSYGAGRITLPPAGTVNCFWETYSGGTPGGTSAMPVAVTGDVLAGSIAIKSSGLSGTASIILQIREWDSNGNYLRSDTLQSVTGNQASWVALSGTVTTGASCAYASLLLNVVDGTAGSANATVWLDNAQCWDVTATGQATMPYCELRFPQAPAQLMVSGLQGDVAAPALTAFGTYITSLSPGATLTYIAGRRAQFGRGAQFCFNTTFNQTVTFALDATNWGGYTVQAAGLSAGAYFEFDPQPFSAVATYQTMSDMLGVYHIYTKAWTNQSTGNVGNITFQAAQRHQNTNKASNPSYGWYGYMSTVTPFTAGSTWTLTDAGNITVPMTGYGAELGNPGISGGVVNFVYAHDANGSGSTVQAGYQALVPIDSSLIISRFLLPSNTLINNFAGMNAWLWVAADPLQGGTGGPVWKLAYPTTSGPKASEYLGGGTSATAQYNFPTINSTADPYLTLDPTIGGGANQIVALLTDAAAAIYPLACEIQYSPLYLYPR